MLLAATALTLAACGGGGSTSPGHSLTPPVTQSPGNGGAGSQQQAISAANGGTVTQSIAGGGTLSVTVPANGLSANANVTIAAYTSASQLPNSPFGTDARHRNTAGLPSDAKFLSASWIDTGSAVATAPFTISESTSVSVPNGDVVRLARYNGTSWNDVDVATVSNGTATNSVDPHYVSVSAGGAAHPYMFYATAHANAPAAISATASSTPSQLDSANQIFAINVADANGNPLPCSCTYAASSDAVTLSPGTAPYTVELTSTGQGGSVNVVVTDPRTSPTLGNYDAQVNIGSSRPMQSGDTFSFAGTMTVAHTYAIAPVYANPSASPGPPVPNDSETANVTQTVTVSPTTDPCGCNVQDFNVQESDAFPTQTLTSTTDDYFQIGEPSNGTSIDYLKGYSSKDEQGNTTSVEYATPGLTIDELPEASGQSWTNSPAETYSANYIDSETINRTVNADGSYNDTENLYDAPIPSPSPGNPAQNYPNTTVISSSTAAGQGDYSVITALPSWFVSPPSGCGPEPCPAPGTPAEYDFQVLPPQPNPTPGATPPSVIEFQGDPGDNVGLPPGFEGDWLPTLGEPQPAFTTEVMDGAWFSLPLVFDSNTETGLYGETDNDLGAVTVPAACNLPNGSPTSANDLQQKTETIDPMMGTIETLQSDQYDALGYGPVCTVTSDVVNEYYDWNLDYYDDGIYYVFLSPNPVMTTTVSETLSLQSSGANNLSRTRDAVAPLHVIPPVAIALSRSEVHRVMRLDLAKRRVAAAHRMSLHFTKGAK